MEKRIYAITIDEKEKLTLNGFRNLVDSHSVFSCKTRTKLFNFLVKNLGVVTNIELLSEFLKIEEEKIITAVFDGRIKGFVRFNGRNGINIITGSVVGFIMNYRLLKIFYEELLLDFHSC